MLCEPTKCSGPGRTFYDRLKDAAYFQAHKLLINLPWTAAWVKKVAEEVVMAHNRGSNAWQDINPIDVSLRKILNAARKMHAICRNANETVPRSQQRIFLRQTLCRTAWRLANRFTLENGQWVAFYAGLSQDAARRIAPIRDALLEVGVQL